MLRAKQLNVRLDEMELLTVGEITDMMVEKANDSYEWEYKATQADIDRFMR